MPTPQENLRTLVETLETTDKAQGKGNLKALDFDDGSTIKYCCLGIASEVVLGRKFQQRGPYIFGYGQDGNMTTVLNREDMEAMNLDQHLTPEDVATLGTNRFTQRDTRMNVLWGLNDSLNKSFKEIAAKIRELGWLDEENGDK